MRLADYLDKGASLDAGAPCLTTGGQSRSYADVQELSRRIAAALAARGVRPGDRVAILSANDPTAFTCVFGISRAGAVWCPVNPRNEAAENRELLGLFGCVALIFHEKFAPLVGQIRAGLPDLTTLVCLDGVADAALSWEDFLALGVTPVDEPARDDLAMIVGTGGTTGRPKGVELTGTNIETMTAITLMSYPFGGRPVYLALAPLTHAAGVLCFPVLALGGEIVVMASPDIGDFLDLVQTRRVTHTFLPPTLIYMVLAHEGLDGTDLSSLQCFWYGAAPISPARLEEALRRIGPVMAQLFGQTEAPMMISAMAPRDHFRPDGTIAAERLASAGAHAAGHSGDHGQRRRAEGPARNRGDRRARLAGHARLPPRPGRHRGGVGVRLAPHRRHRLPGRGQLPVHRRPRQGHGHHRRLQRLLDRGRAGDHAASRGTGLRRHRAAGREVGRAGHRRGATARRPHR